MSLFAELKRRNVFRVAVAYIIIAWLILQVGEVLAPALHLPDWINSALAFFLILGFPMALFLAWAFELTPEGIKRERAVDRSTSITGQTGRKLDRLIIAVLAVAVGWILLDRFVFEERTAAPATAAIDEAGPPPATEESAVEPPAGPSVAVLPFINMSGDAENEYFSDGLTETLLHMLAQIPDLRVAARTSSFSFKGKDITIAEVADTLNVANVLEGSVQKSGDRVRVTAQLIRADDGFHVWSQNYTRPLEDIFAIQDEIATDVANALDASLLGSGAREVHAVATDNLSAYDAYLKGLEQQSIFSYASLDQAENLFKQALAADPRFIEAKLALARNHIFEWATGKENEATTRARMEPLIRQVREEQPDNPLARALELMTELQSDRLREREDFVTIVEELRGLLAEIPTETFARIWVASTMQFLDQDFQGALEVLQAGLLVDPLAAALHARIGETYRDMERYDEAEASLMRAIELDPRDPAGYTRMSRLHGSLGDILGKLEWMRRATEVDPQDHELAANLAYIFYDLHLVEEGNRWASRVSAIAPDSDFITALAIVEAYTREDFETTRDRAETAIAEQIAFRGDSFGTALFVYIDAMSWLGDYRAASEFLVRTRPEAGDFDTPPPDLHAAMMEMANVQLMYGFAEPSTTRQAFEKVLTHVEATGYPWMEDEENQVIAHAIRGELDEAERVLLEVFAKPLAEWPARVDVWSVPLWREVTGRPAVAARLAELEREHTRMREDVLAMLEGPEWQ